MHYCSQVDHTTLLAATDKTDDREAIDGSLERRHANKPHVQEQTTSANKKEETKTSCLQSVRQMYIKEGFGEDTIDLFMASWREGTKKQYQTYLNKWFKFCSENAHEPHDFHEKKVIAFFTSISF